VKINYQITDLCCLLYMGGAACNTRTFNGLVEGGGLGVPRSERQPLVELLCSYFEKKLLTHKFVHVWLEMYNVRRFYAACDELSIDLTLDNVLLNYEAYINKFWMLTHLGRSRLSERAVYQADLALRRLLRGALNLPDGVLSPYRRAEVYRRGDKLVGK